MLDIIGPANAPNATTTRPTDDRSFGTTDTWFKDCSSSTANDGTKLKAAFMNAVAGVVRALIRMNGNTASAAAIVTEDNSDDAMAVKAIQHMVQRGQPKWAIATGTASAIAIALSPAAAEYKAGMQLCVYVPNSPVGPATVNVNGLGAKNLLKRNSLPVGPNDYFAGDVIDIIYDGTSWQLIGAGAQPVLSQNVTYYVSTTGNDANNGLTALTPFLTIQKAINTALKFNSNGYTIEIKCADGNYTAGGSVGTQLYGGGRLLLTGNVTTPANCKIGVSAGSCVYASYYGSIDVQGFRFASDDPSNGGVTAQFGGAVNIVGKCEFNNCAGYHIGALALGQVRIQSNYAVTGGAGAHWLTESQGRVAKDTVAGITVSIGAGLSIGIWAQSTTLSYQSVNGITFTYDGGQPTGAKYQALNNSIINTLGAGGSYLPGSSAGAVANGGLYI